MIILAIEATFEADACLRLLVEKICNSPVRVMGDTFVVVFLGKFIIVLYIEVVFESRSDVVPLYVDVFVPVKEWMNELIVHEEIKTIKKRNVTALLLNSSLSKITRTVKTVRSINEIDPHTRRNMNERFGIGN